MSKEKWIKLYLLFQNSHLNESWIDWDQEIVIDWHLCPVNHQDRPVYHNDEFFVSEFVAFFLWTGKCHPGIESSMRVNGKKFNNCLIKDKIMFFATLEQPSSKRLLYAINGRTSPQI